MPMYHWGCKICGKALDILRSFEDFRDPPSAEEVPATDPPCEHDWDKKIHAPLVSKAPGWGGKGYWVQWLTLASGGIGEVLRQLCS